MNRHNNHKDAGVLAAVMIAVAIIIFGLMLTSCSRGITPFDAANGKAKCGRHLK